VTGQGLRGSRVLKKKRGSLKKHVRSLKGKRSGGTIGWGAKNFPSMTLQKGGEESNARPQKTKVRLLRPR